MAVYTQVPAEDIDAFLTRYDAGRLVSAKGIAEGVENSNYLVDTTTGRFILTLYEKRVDLADLPFFFAMTDALAAAGNPVPRALPDRTGQVIQTLEGRPACLIEFLTGVSVSDPTPAQARAAGRALGAMHAGLTGFAPTRVRRPAWIESSWSAQSANSLGHAATPIELARFGANPVRLRCNAPSAAPAACACSGVGWLTDTPDRNSIRQAGRPSSVWITCPVRSGSARGTGLPASASASVIAKKKGRSARFTRFSYSVRMKRPVVVSTR